MTTGGIVAEEPPQAVTPPALPYPWCKQPDVCRGSCPLDPSCGE